MKFSNHPEYGLRNRTEKLQLIGSILLSGGLGLFFGLLVIFGVKI